MVLAVIQDAGMRAYVRADLEIAGHRIIEADGCLQAELLLNNGLHPDLVLIACTSFQGHEADSCRRLLRSAPADKTCVIAGAGHEGLLEEARGLGIRFPLRAPLTRTALATMVNRIAPGAESRVARGPAGAHPARTSAVHARLSDSASVAPYLEELDGGSFFLAASPAMLEIHRQVKLLADADVNVLILGESGTGKEVIAQLIHASSQRHREKFLKVNCAALPAELMESELFGHRQGAFTGAVKDHQGKFEQAHGGTLLLDEIGELGVQIQAKLLHVLQDGQFTRLGGQETARVNVRVLAATNVRIENALLEKTFREDLYYRLSVFTIHVPPLRERREEIAWFIQETLRRAPEEMKKNGLSRFPSRLLDAALRYDWPGNLRELRNFVTRTIIMRDADTAIRELETKIDGLQVAPLAAFSDADQPQRCGMRSVVRDMKERAEAQMIQDALEASRWNRRQAAQLLKISYRALLYKIQQHHLIPRPTRSLNEPAGIN
jgi:DNA-binding NtrC family response regulator